MLFNKFKSFLKSRRSVEENIPKFKLKEKHIKNCKLILNRENLLNKLPKKSIVAELGVDRGDFSKDILSKTNAKLLCLIDLWSSNRYGEKKAKEINKKFKKEIDSGQVKIYRTDSISAADSFDDNFFDWIYIDTDHSYQTTYAELITWSKKIKIDGIIAGHDYMMGNWLKSYRYGVIEAVHQFCVEHNWQIILLTVVQTENLSFAIKRI